MGTFTEQAADYCGNFKQFLSVIEKYGNDPAVTWYTKKGEKQTRSYCELVSDIRILENCFIRKGLSGKHIAIVGENSYEWLQVYFAAAACGAVSVCIDPEQSEESIYNMVEWADSEAVFVSQSCAGLFTGGERRIFRLDSGDSERMSVKDLTDRESQTGEYVSEAVCPNGDSTAAIVYTSGTTALSKPVMLSHRAVLINAAESNLAVDGGKCCFSALPFCHTYGMTCAVIATLLRGAELVFNGDMRTTMRDMSLSGAYSMLTVPLVVELLYQQMWNRAEQEGRSKELKKAFMYQALKRRFGFKNIPNSFRRIKKSLFGNIDLIICGGAHLDVSMAKKLDLIGVQVLEGYGITECSPLVSVNRYGSNRLHTVGKPLPGCKVRIVDGEIQVSGPNVMKGYYKMDKETEKVLQDGWFRTGDLGEIDKDGYLKITGRKKSLIVFKNGKKVSPEAYEKKLKKIPVIDEVLVYGAPVGGSLDDVRVAASIYPNQIMVKDMTSYEILEALQTEVDKLNNTLPFYQQIQMIHIRGEEFEKNTMNKIKRYV